MSVTLKYSYRKFNAKPSGAFPGRLSVSRPVIPIQLIRGADKVKYLAIIDSGADFCIFHASIGEVIGLAVESGKLQHFSGVSGLSQQLTAYFHSIQIEIGGYAFNCWAGFSRDIEDLPYGFLGQLGFFNLFNVHLDFTKERIELKTKDSV
ncbi:hypothetical protein ES707_21621 [subsurface metagenome]